MLSYEHRKRKKERKNKPEKEKSVCSEKNIEEWVHAKQIRCKIQSSFSIREKNEFLISKYVQFVDFVYVKNFKTHEATVPNKQILLEYLMQIWR